MRGDQLSRQWRVIRAMEASPNGLTVAEIAISFYPFKFKIPPIVSRKVAKFAKKTVLYLLALNIYLVQFLGRVSQRGKRAFAFLAPWREGIG